MAPQSRHRLLALPNRPHSGFHPPARASRRCDHRSRSGLRRGPAHSARRSGGVPGPRCFRHFLATRSPTRDLTTCATPRSRTSTGPRRTSSSPSGSPATPIRSPPSRTPMYPMKRCTGTRSTWFTVPWSERGMRRRYTLGGARRGAAWSVRCQRSIGADVPRRCPRCGELRDARKFQRCGRVPLLPQVVDA